MVCSVGLAANDYKDLAKQQQVVEKFMDVFDGEPVPAYVQVSASFSADMKKAITENVFAEIQKQARIKFGTIKEAKLVTFHRADKGDLLTYMASFSKENNVKMVFAFDKQNKLMDFAFTPIKQVAGKK